MGGAPINKIVLAVSVVLVLVGGLMMLTRSGNSGVPTTIEGLFGAGPSLVQVHSNVVRLTFVAREGKWAVACDGELRVTIRAWGKGEAGDVVARLKVPVARADFRSRTVGSIIPMGSGTEIPAVFERELELEPTVELVKGGYQAWVVFTPTAGAPVTTPLPPSAPAGSPAPPIDLVLTEPVDPRAPAH